MVDSRLHVHVHAAKRLQATRQGSLESLLSMKQRGVVKYSESKYIDTNGITVNALDMTLCFRQFVVHIQIKRD